MADQKFIGGTPSARKKLGEMGAEIGALQKKVAQQEVELNALRNSGAYVRSRMILDDGAGNLSADTVRVMTI